MAPDPAEIFCDSFGIRPRQPDLDLLHELGLAFSRLPYENLTKLIKKSRVPAGPQRRRLPAEVITDHLQHGTGGTCFALTRLFAAVLERLGYRCRPVLCDMRHGRDSHCALLVELPTGPHLLDPGYQLHRPLPIIAAGEPAQLTETPAAARLVADPSGATCDLSTYGTWRYRIKLAAVPEQRFLDTWDASFDWTMMNGIHLCAAQTDGYAYLHNHHLRLRQPGARQNLNIRNNEAETLAGRFGISAAVTEEAFRVLAELRADRRSRDAG